MKKIFVCSPLRGDIEGNIKKAKRYCRSITLAGDMPIAPHVYFTQFLDDNKWEERAIGMHGGLELLEICDEMWVFGMLLTKGMEIEIKEWHKTKKKLIFENSLFVIKYSTFFDRIKT